MVRDKGERTSMEGGGDFNNGGVGVRNYLQRTEIENIKWFN